MNELANKRVIVLGAGASGVSAALLARQKGAEVRLVDSGRGERLADTERQLSPKGIRVEAGWQPTDEKERCDLAVISPGVPSESPMARHFLNSGVRMVSELEFGSWFCDVPKLAITGTNGKTTVVEMLTHCIAGIGKRVQACGNIGFPLSQVAADGTEDDWLVVEVSSYQLEMTEHFASRAAALLNITPDHLSRHHTMEAYRDLKLKLLQQVSPEGVCVLRADLAADPAVIQALKGKRLLTFTSDDHGADYVVRDGSLCRIIADSCTRLLPVVELPYDGAHNYENCLAVLAMGEAAGLSPAELAPHLATFHIGPHRMEVVWEHNGVRYVNDSKATNLDAMVQSLRKFGTGRRDIALLAGGLTKGCDLGEALPAIRENVKGAFLIGVSRHELAALWGEAVPCVECESLQEAFDKAAACVATGGTVLLSPGCASQDMFKDYIERGRSFVNLVERLRDSELEQERQGR